jgi:hypothetical protein
MAESPNEARRLAELYAGMSDGELERLTEASAELSEEARNALRTEIAKRDLVVSGTEPPQPPTYDEPELQKWSVVRRFRDLPEATLAKGALDSAGIENHLADENMVRLDWFISNLLGGVKLVVKPEDLESAQHILDEPIPADIEYSEGENFTQPACPQCGSLEISSQDMAKGVALATLYVTALPLPVSTRKWRCENCGNSWTEEPAET